MQDFVRLGQELTSHSYAFKLLPSLWTDRHRDSALAWRCVPFGDDGSSHVPDDAPGVYAFCIRPGVGGDLCSSYVMYIGQTTRTLRARYREYLAERTAKKARPKLVRLFDQTHGHDCLYFCYALTEGTGDDSPEAIEDRLLNAFIPPVNSALPAKVRKAVKAFE